MGIALNQAMAAEAASLRLYVPRHARPPRPVRAARSARARLGRRVAIIGTHVCDLGARLQLAREQHGRAWA